MNAQVDPAKHAIEQASHALRRGNRSEARRWAQRAVRLAPDREDGWLILAALSSPKASLVYLKQALEINPGSTRARQGMHWAIQRLRSSSAAAPVGIRPVHRVAVQKFSPQDLVRPRPALMPWAVLCLLILAALAFRSTSLAALPSVFQAPALAVAQVELDKETRTPTATVTYTPTATSTNTPTSTSTSTPTETPTPTDTPTPVPTDTPTMTPTAVPTEVPTEPPPEPKQAKRKKNKAAAQQQFPGKPGGVGGDERWIDVDLSAQTTYAYEGDTLVNSFVVSTGTWQHPTVTGSYQIYVKLRYTDMAGPGYYLADVPNTMYFYKGYGLHGTYWHNNFGTPMSHGCVNLSIADSQWLFNWASVGTIVNVHD